MAPFGDHYVFVRNANLREMLRAELAISPILFAPLIIWGKGICRDSRPEHINVDCCVGDIALVATAVDIVVLVMMHNEVAVDVKFSTNQHANKTCMPDRL